jgi:hypothetical protein
MRRAVEQHLKPAPLVVDQHSADHPWNRGLIFAAVGNLTVYMLVENPGEFFLDDMCKRPATDDMARAAFGHADFAKYRHQAREVAGDRRIEQAVAAVAASPSPEQLRAERAAALRAKAEKALRQVQAETQRQADLMITRDLGEPIPG